MYHETVVALRACVGVSHLRAERVALLRYLSSVPRSFRLLPDTQLLPCILSDVLPFFSAYRLLWGFCSISGVTDHERLEKTKTTSRITTPLPFLRSSESPPWGGLQAHQHTCRCAVREGELEGLALWGCNLSIVHLMMNPMNPTASRFVHVSPHQSGTMNSFGLPLPCSHVANAKRAQRPETTPYCCDGR